MDDVVPQAGTPADKIREESLVQNLIFVFFAHDEARYDQIKLSDEAKNEAIKDLIKALKIVHDAIKGGNFNRNEHKWITDDIINSSFKRFATHYDCIRKENIPFENQKSKVLPYLFSAIACVSRDIFTYNELIDQDSETIENNNSYEETDNFIIKVRSLLRISGTKDKFSQQIKVLGQIEHQLRPKTERNDIAITFDERCRLTVKTHREDFFSTTNGLQNLVQGRWLVFRKLFTPIVPGEDYIREYLRIRRFQTRALIFTWETQGGQLREAGEINGGVVLTDQAFWLIGHALRPRRMRMMTANVEEWKRFHEGKIEFCTGVVLGHREEGVHRIPCSRLAIFHRETSGDWQTEKYGERVRHLTRVEIEAVLPQDQIALLDAEIDDAQRTVLAHLYER